MLAQEEQNHQVGKREDQRPTFPFLAEDEEKQASGVLNQLVQRNAGRAQTSKKVTVVVDSGAAENVMPRGTLSEISTEFVRKSTWQVADVRRPLVSACHIFQAGSDLFIGKNEADIMNRKKKEKSVLRKEGNVYVLDFFVDTAPIKYKPMERNQSSHRRKRTKQAGSRRRLTAANQFFDGRKSNRGRLDQASRNRKTTT